MNNSGKPPGWSQSLREEIKALLSLNTPSRPWHIALIATIAMATPMLIGIYLGQIANATLACVGTLVILYMPRTRIAQRILTLATCTLGLVICFFLGLCAGFNLYASALVLGLTAIISDYICRYYALPAPGNFFFIFFTALGCTLPFQVDLIPIRTGLVALGCLLACILALFYSLTVALPPAQAAVVDRKNKLRIMLESLVMGIFVGCSFLIAELMGLEKPYWVPISCAAIMQGSSFKMVRHRNIHRIVGTALGMGLAWCIFSLPLQGWPFALAVILLFFMVEILVVHHYGLAVIFITPLTMLLAEGSAAQVLHESLAIARMGDIVLGSSIGLIGGWVMHHPRILHFAEQALQDSKGAKPRL